MLDAAQRVVAGRLDRLGVQHAEGDGHVLRLFVAVAGGDDDIRAEISRRIVRDGGGIGGRKRGIGHSGGKGHRDPNRCQGG